MTRVQINERAYMLYGMLVSTPKVLMQGNGLFSHGELVAFWDGYDCSLRIQPDFWGFRRTIRKKFENSGTFPHSSVLLHPVAEVVLDAAVRA